MEQELRDFEDQTSNQLVVVTFSSLEGEALEDFSIHLAEAWKIGQKGKDNGVILLIFKDDRKVRIEVGYGLEGALTDATSQLIIENEIKPRFREGKFDEGVEAAVQAIMAATKGEYRGTGQRKNFAFKYFHSFINYAWLLFMIFASPIVLWILSLTFIVVAVWAALFLRDFFLAFVLFLVSVVLIVIYFVLGLFFPARARAMLSRDGSVWTSGGFGGGFGGGSFGGGFGGGGGGSFGGGGASGGW